MKRVLVACECSQVVTSAFLEAGFSAFSCDLQPVMFHARHPEQHIIADCRDIITRYEWDLIIAHPPCTYLSAVGAQHLHMNLPSAQQNHERIRLMYEAVDFFMWFIHNRTCPLCIENPRPHRYAALPAATQVVEPWMWGSPWMKRTLLWLYDLPPLFPTHAKPLHPRSWMKHAMNQQHRSRFFEEIAQAMVMQWTGYF